MCGLNVMNIPPLHYAHWTQTMLNINKKSSWKVCDWSSELTFQVESGRLLQPSTESSGADDNGRQLKRLCWEANDCEVKKRKREGGGMLSEFIIINFCMK